MKVRPREATIAEVEGMTLLRDTGAVPKLIHAGTLGSFGYLWMQRVGEVGVDRGLLAHALARNDFSRIQEVVEGHLEFLRARTGEGRWTEASVIRQDLFQARTRSRLSRLRYAINRLGPSVLDLKWEFKDERLGVCLGDLLERLDQWANSRGERAFVILSQGDATECNISEPFCYVDLKYSGYNSLVGEMATFIWALLGQGSYFVPRYNSAAVKAHRLLIRDAARWRPSCRVEVQSSAIRIEQWSAPQTEGRRYAAVQFLESAWPLAEGVHKPEGVSADQAMLPYLLARILITFDPMDLTPEDLWFNLAAAVLAAHHLPRSFADRTIYQWSGK